jgi:hypothetical protein
MRYLMVLFVVFITLSGCATANLPADATPEAKRVALCSDAQMGYALSMVMLDSKLTTDENVYWVVYKNGASLALKTYCVK